MPNLNFKLLAFILLGSSAFHQLSAQSHAAKSILINIGSNTTTIPASGETYLSTFTDIRLGTTFPNATVLSDDVVFTTSIFNKAIAYNPAVDTIYTISDLASPTTSFFDYGFGEPYDWTYPGLKTTPAFYEGLTNNCEFDNRAQNRLWFVTGLTTSGFTLNSLNSSDRDPSSLTSVNINFPAGSLPGAAVGTNDFVILPNNRMFLVVGENGDLYEITDYTTTTPSINHLITTGAGIAVTSLAYINGSLMLASYGANSDAYKYDIATAALTGPFAFPGNARLHSTPAPATVQEYATVDATSTTLSVASAHRIKQSLTCAAYADITYQVMLKNTGKIDLATPQIIEDLGAAFPSATISSVSVTAVSNPGALVLNASYNGTTVTNLIDNTIDKPLVSGTNGPDSIVLEVSFTVSGLTSGTTYNINAVASGKAYQMVGGIPIPIIEVEDTSNNGTTDLIVYDPNNNGIADDSGEAAPTAFLFAPPAVGDPCVLPVSLLHFNASVKEGDVFLNWKAASEEQIKKYIVERSVNGTNWELLTVQHAKNNVKTTQEYAVSDKNPLDGSSFYRLKMEDIDGNFSYSQVKKVDIDVIHKLVARPNPTAGIIYISNLNPGKLSVTNSFGQFVSTPVTFISSSVAMVDLSYLASGTYYISNQSQSISVVKK